MRLIDLVEASAAVARTASRLEKVAILADLLGRLGPDEVSLAIAFLSGTPGTGRIGVGGALLRRAARDAADEPTLDLTSVGEAFHDVSRTTGRGSAAERERKLGALFARATTTEQDFLARLIFGELRQGALEGVLIEAVARAASVPPASVRRAAMMSGDLGAVARAAMASGKAGLQQFSVMLMRPVDPMLADSADSVAA